MVIEWSIKKARKARILIYLSSVHWMLIYWSLEFFIKAQWLRFSQIQTYYEKAHTQILKQEARQGSDFTILYPFYSDPLHVYICVIFRLTPLLHRPVSLQVAALRTRERRH